MTPIRKLANQLADIATEAEAGTEPDPFDLRIIARRLQEQAHSLTQDQGGNSCSETDEN